jgi:hypothetical protein
MIVGAMMASLMMTDCGAAVYTVVEGLDEQV